MKFEFYKARSKREQGQGFAEYALLLVFIGISTVLVMAALNAVIEGSFENVTKCIHNSGSRALTSSNCEAALETPNPPSTTGSSTASTGSTTASTGSTTGSTTGAPSGNLLPQANFSVSCPTGLSCTFTSTSTDSDGTIASASWEFDDPISGTNSATGNSASHTFSAAGQYNVSLTVTDDDGASKTLSKLVNVTTGSTTGSSGNVSPTANFSSTCTNLSCSFTSTSTDSDGTIASASWTFGEPASGSNTATGNSASHTFAAAGNYTVSLTVIDDDGASRTFSKTVTVTTGSTTGSGNVDPVANFASNCTALTCTFSDSSTDDGTIVTYAWAFGDSTTGNVASPSKTYSAAGTYSVTLTVTDDGGATNSVTKSVTVTSSNNPPVAAISNTCLNLVCDFSGSDSTDVGGSISSYAWNFGDSSTGAGISFTKTYAAAGTYTVTLTVTDNLGATNTTTKSVTVASAATYAIKDVDTVHTMTGNKMNLTAVTLTIRNNSNAAVSGVVVTISGGISCTSDASGTCTLNVTDIQLNNNGSQAYTISSVTGGTGTYTAANNGNTDGDAHTASTSTITINNSGGTNASPTADFTAPTCTAGVACSFVSSSTDDGTITTYAWAFGDSSTGNTATFSKTYSTAGTYSVTLTVTDDGGATGTVTKSVTVSAAANTAPVANFTAPTCTVNVACSFVSTSTDSQGVGTITTFAWDFGDSSTGNTSTFSKTYASVGSYNVSLTVTDNGGLSHSVTKTVTVTAAAVTYAIKDVDWVGSVNGNKFDLTAVTITVLNSSNAAVSGVTVTVTGSVSCVTNASGTCTLDVPNLTINNNGSQSYTIVSVTGGTGTYTAANNANTDGDGHTINSTTITLNN
jgi:PKD repeat protein/Flp pilus assembly pilin Flp